ncbi:TPA: hypothetical protein HA251_02495 [Candidatus Woesearchaeota archaeon]|nr:hypothetical protein [Candidatus Woesearchaeota archaeon]
MSIVLQTPLLTLEVPEKGAAKGHARITSVSSSPEDIALLGFCASILSNVLYEKMQAGGTSIVISIAKDDVRADILARQEDDGVDLQWEYKPGDPAQLDAVQERIRAKTFFIKNDPPAKLSAAASNAGAAGAHAQSSQSSPAHSKVSSSGAAGASASELPSVPPPATASPAGGDVGAATHRSANDEDDERDDYLIKQLHRIP